MNIEMYDTTKDNTMKEDTEQKMSQERDTKDGKGMSAPQDSSLEDAHTSNKDKHQESGGIDRNCTRVDFTGSINITDHVENAEMTNGGIMKAATKDGTGMTGPQGDGMNRPIQYSSRDRSNIGQ